MYAYIIFFLVLRSIIKKWGLIYSFFYYIEDQKNTTSKTTELHRNRLDDDTPGPSNPGPSSSHPPNDPALDKLFKKI